MFVTLLKLGRQLVLLSFEFEAFYDDEWLKKKHGISRGFWAAYGFIEIKAFLIYNSSFEHFFFTLLPSF